MLDEKARDFLTKPILARLSTVDPDGYPHTVPVWYMLDGTDVVFISVRATRKVRNLLINPKGAVAVGGEPADGGGYLVKGDLSIEEDPRDEWVKKFCYHYEEKAKAEKDIADWADMDIVLLRLGPRSVSKF
jgi:predicted pyridoxine 5'-phosphate oxidase superfamily flavin-nucleotide-binding protein